MIIKLLIKFYPALIPILTYALWNFLMKKIKRDAGIIDASVEDNKSLLKDDKFIIALTISMLIMIVCFMFLAIEGIKRGGEDYSPAKYENGKIITSTK